MLRFVLGVKITLHLKDDVPLQFNTADVLLICNHRSRIDWMFIWGLAAAMGRLGRLKIVIASLFKKVPGFGWAMQCFGFLFMVRTDRYADLRTLKEGADLHIGRRSVVLIFPEGTDLSENNLQKCNAFRKERGLPPRSQVLHPKMAGMVTLWQAWAEPSWAQPVLLDATIGYVDYIPGERPSEKSFFADGRCCREVHIRLERMKVTRETDKETLDRLCLESFDDKETRLSRFYAPCAKGEAPDLSALSEGTRSVSMLSVRETWSSLLVGIAAICSLHAGLFLLAWKVGFIATFFIFVGACGCFHMIGSLTGGIDKVLLRAAASGREHGKLE
jgi:1-acyl-sn-glycerol-3-phosphate acyltransferase